MEKNPKTNLVSVSLLLLFLLFGCQTDGPEYVQVETMKNHGWAVDKPVEFQYKPMTTGQKNIFIYIENTNDYPYSNIYLIATMEQGNKVKVDTFEYDMADGSGKWLGNKVRNTYENYLIYRLHWSVNDTVPVRISLQPATRPIDKTEGDSFLKGIEKVGIIIENVKPKQ